MKILKMMPSNKEQLAALKAVMKALDIDFFVLKSRFNPKFLAKIKRAESQIRNRESRRILPADV